MNTACTIKLCTLFTESNNNTVKHLNHPKSHALAKIRPKSLNAY